MIEAMVFYYPVKTCTSQEGGWAGGEGGVGGGLS